MKVVNLYISVLTDWWKPDTDFLVVWILRQIFVIHLDIIFIEFYVIKIAPFSCCVDEPDEMQRKKLHSLM